MRKKQFGCQNCSSHCSNSGHQGRVRPGNEGGEQSDLGEGLLLAGSVTRGPWVGPGWPELLPSCCSTSPGPPGQKDRLGLVSSSSPSQVRTLSRREKVAWLVRVVQDAAADPRFQARRRALCMKSDSVQVCMGSRGGFLASLPRHCPLMECTVSVCLILKLLAFLVAHLE